MPAPTVATPSKPVAAVVPAKPPAPVAAPIAAPTPPVAKPAPTPVESGDVKAAESAVMAWAKAWAAKDMNAYLGAYSPEFAPAGKQSRSAWEKERRDRITSKSRISVTLSKLSAKVTGNEAVVKFHQAYKADALSVSSRKTLTLKKHGNQWLITQESTGN
jgi:ketosteroid isomerase-like protein